MSEFCRNCACVHMCVCPLGDILIQVLIPGSWLKSASAPGASVPRVVMPSEQGRNAENSLPSVHLATVCHLAQPQKHSVGVTDSKPSFHLEEIQQEELLRICSNSGYIRVIKFRGGFLLFHQSLPSNPTQENTRTKSGVFDRVLGSHRMNRV